MSCGSIWVALILPQRKYCLKIDWAQKAIVCLVHLKPNAMCCSHGRAMGGLWHCCNTIDGLAFTSTRPCKRTDSAINLTEPKWL